MKGTVMFASLIRLLGTIRKVMVGGGGGGGRRGISSLQEFSAHCLCKNVCLTAYARIFLENLLCAQFTIELRWGYTQF